VWSFFFMELVGDRLEPLNPTCRWHVGRRERAPALPYSLSCGQRGNEPRHPLRRSMT